MQASFIVTAFLVWGLGMAVGLLLDTILLRAASYWVLRQHVGFWRAATTCLLVGAPTLVLGALVAILFAFLGITGTTGSIASWVLALVATLAIGGAIIAPMLKTTYRRAVGVAAVKTALGVALIAVGAFVGLLPSL